MPPNTAVLYCAVLEDEIESLAAKMPHIVMLEKLPQGLHNEPPKLRMEVQEVMRKIEANPAVETVVLGYGLCSRGIEGIVPTRTTVVIPRAHDCITLLLGSKERYQEYVDQHPGTYWYSVGWNRHHVPPGPDRMEALRKSYSERFDEDDVEYLLELEGTWMSKYDTATFIDTGLGDVEKASAYTSQCAKCLGWNFDRQIGSPALIRALLEGPWDEDRFLTLHPGETPVMTADERIIAATHAN